MVSLPPHLQARPATRREDSKAEKAIDDLLARRPAARADASLANTSLTRDPPDIQVAISRLHALVTGKNLQQLLATYRGRGSLLDLLL